MPNRKKFISDGAWIPLALVLTLAIGFLTGLKTGKQSDLNLFSIEKKKSMSSFKVDEVLGFISQRYVDSIDVDALAEAAIKMVIDSLDPHSSYMDAEEVSYYRNKMKGQFDGMGIEFRQLNDTIVITNVIENSPASKTEMEAGDQLITFNDSVISGVNRTLNSIYDIMRGGKGSVAKLELVACDGYLKNIEITRNTIKTKSVPFCGMVDDQLGYISVRSFNSQTSKEFLDALEPFHESGQLKHLIIDLRGNPGGYLQEAVKMLNQFFDKKGELLVYTEGMNSSKMEYESAGKPYLNIDRVYVLIDEESASASEILAGALQDLDRGTIVGRRSFGKGLVQEQYQLSDGGNLKLTVAKYYTPSGRLIQTEFFNRKEYKQAFKERHMTGELVDFDKIPLPDTTAYYSKSGRKLFGGRGIVPDIFIPMDSVYLDSLSYNWYFLKERIAFELFRTTRCFNVPIKEVEQGLFDEVWIENITPMISNDASAELQNVPDFALRTFPKDLFQIFSRYTDKWDGFFNVMLDYDPYILAVQKDIQLHESESLTTQKD